MSGRAVLTRKLRRGLVADFFADLAAYVVAVVHARGDLLLGSQVARHGAYRAENPLGSTSFEVDKLIGYQAGKSR
jgi:hypothetical protein